MQGPYVRLHPKIREDGKMTCSREMNILFSSLWDNLAVPEFKLSKRFLHFLIITLE